MNENDLQKTAKISYSEFYCNVICSFLSYPSYPSYPSHGLEKFYSMSYRQCYEVSDNVLTIKLVHK